ncbi:DUF1534 domain-containing protein [Pseudomonas syringae]|nr:DUF1534 domain-containing protein [Pseudomonas syringae]
MIRLTARSWAKTVRRKSLRLSFLTLQRWNAVRDARVTDLRRTLTLKIGRRASRTACDAERRTIIRA